MSKLDTGLIKKWLLIAKQDYDVAQFLFDNHWPKPLEIIGFHCQQSIEKAFKGYICAQGDEVRRIHSLKLLCMQCAKFDKSFGAFYEDCSEFEFLAVETRYPNSIEIDEDNLKKALKLAADIYNFALSKVRATGIEL